MKAGRPMWTVSNVGMDEVSDSGCGEKEKD